MKTEARSLLKTPNVDIQGTLDSLTADWLKLDKLWTNRKQRLEEGAELHRLNQEADRIGGVADSVQSVHSLLKRHDELEALIRALDQRVELFAERCHQLVEQQHYASRHVRERSRSIHKAHRRLKESCRERRTELLQAQRKQEFLRDAEELLLWMDEKMKIAEDESYRDPTNILHKLNRHEALEKEMEANKERLERLLQALEKEMEANKERLERLLQVNNNKQTITNILHKLNRHEALEKEMEANKERLERLLQVNNNNKQTITNILHKLNRHEALEKEMEANKERLERLLQVSSQIQAEDHHSSQTLSRKSSQLSSRWRRLQEQMSERGDKLRQAGQQEQLMDLLQDAKVKMEAIQWMLNNAAKGHDLRSSRQLLK
ncbi:hypothetical protein WMY93_033748, partial [Mugilogobius chulae]